MKNYYRFIAIFNYAEDGISISYPDLPGCLSCAKNEEQAFKRAKEVLEFFLWGMEKDKEEIPEPTKLKDIILGDGDVPVLVEVFMQPIRDKMANSFTKKTLSIPTWLNALGEEKKVNFSKILQNALIQYMEITETERGQNERND